MIYEGFIWLEQDDYDKLIGQCKLKIANILSYFDCYGLDIEMPLGQIMIVLKDALMRVRGDDRPIAPDISPRPRPTS